MSDTKKDIIVQEVRNFFKNISWKNILTFLFFVFLSSIFWMMLIYRQKFEASLSIPIKYVNVPDSILFENDLPTVINIRFRDDGAALFRYYFTRKNDSLVINIRDIIRDPSESSVVDLIRKKLFVSSEILSYYPDHISFVHATLHHKKVPVIYDGHIDLPSGYMIDGDIVIKPDSVTVYGNDKTLDSIHYAHTNADTLKNVTEYKNIHVVMKPIKGIRYVPNRVELLIPVDEFTLKEVEVPVKCINLPDNLKIKFFPSMVKIPFYVGLKRYKYINENNFQVKVDYNEIKDLKETSVPIRITESPDYIRTLTPIPTDVEFILEQE